MKKITPDPPAVPLAAADSNNPWLDRTATERALNFYLQGHKPVRPMGTAMYAIPDSVNSEAGPRATWCCRPCTWWSWPRVMSTNRWIHWQRTEAARA